MREHRHNWYFIAGPDETGGIVACKSKECKETAFLEPKEVKKFQQLKKEGVKNNEIILTEVDG